MGKNFKKRAGIRKNKPKIKLAMIANRVVISRDGRVLRS